MEKFTFAVWNHFKLNGRIIFYSFLRTRKYQYLFWNPLYLMRLFSFSLLAKFLMIIAVYATYVYLPMVSKVPRIMK